jgi:hypothetical protein
MTDVQSITESLEHAGVLGMKWGVHRSRSAKAAAKAEAKAAGDNPAASTSPSSKPAKSAKAAPTRTSVKDMSDAELKAFITRVELEQKFVRLTTPEKSAGRKIAENIVKDVGTQLAKEVVKSHFVKVATKVAAKPKPVRPKITTYSP